MYPASHFAQQQIPQPPGISNTFRRNPLRAGGIEPVSRQPTNMATVGQQRSGGMAPSSPGNTRQSVLDRRGALPNYGANSTQPSGAGQMGTYNQTIPNNPGLGTPQQYVDMYSQNMGGIPQQQGYMGDVMRMIQPNAQIDLMRMLAPVINQQNAAYQEAAAQEGLANQNYLLGRYGSALNQQQSLQNIILSALMGLV